MKTNEFTVKATACQVNPNSNIFYSQGNKLEEMNDLLRDCQNPAFLKKREKELRSDRMIAQHWWKD